MVPYYGDFPVNHTGVVIPFNAFTSNDPSASATITDFANTDVHIHKNGSLTQRASSSGVAIDIDVDAITGGHWITIDLSDNDDAGFYVAGSEISVRVEGVTIDGATVNAFVGSFSIERAGGTVALLKLIQAATITNAAGADVAADIIALKAVADAIPTTAMRGTDNAALATVLGAAVGASISADIAAVKSVADDVLTDTGTTIPGTITTAQNDLDLLTGADGATLATLQGNYAPNVVVPDAAGVAPTAAEIRTAMEAAGSDLSYLMIALVNKMIVTELTGNTEQFNDADSTLGSIAAAFSTDGTYTTRKRLVI